MSRSKRVAVIAGCAVAAAAAGAGAIVVVRRVRDVRRIAPPSPQRAAAMPQPAEPARAAPLEPVVDAPLVAGDDDAGDAPESSPRVRRRTRVAVIAVVVVVVVAALASATAVVALRDRESATGDGGRLPRRPLRSRPPRRPPRRMRDGSIRSRPAGRTSARRSRAS